jgi:hypothetical protein
MSKPIQNWPSCDAAVKDGVSKTLQDRQNGLRDLVHARETSRNALTYLRSQRFSIARRSLDWACAPSSGRGLPGQASRLKVVRRFLSHLQAAIPERRFPLLEYLATFDVQNPISTLRNRSSSSWQTTHGYIEAGLLIKEQALQKLAPAGQATARFKPDDALLRFLTSL